MVRLGERPEVQGGWPGGPTPLDRYRTWLAGEDRRHPRRERSCRDPVSLPAPEDRGMCPQRAFYGPPPGGLALWNLPDRYWLREQPRGDQFGDRFSPIAPWPNCHDPTDPPAGARGDHLSE